MGVAVVGAPAVFESNSQAVVNNTQDNIAEQPLSPESKVVMYADDIPLYRPILAVNFCSRMLKHLENGLTITILQSPLYSQESRGVDNFSEVGGIKFVACNKSPIYIWTLLSIS